uniref:F-box domain-containing protein n=1 Tax=Mycena chlorophos TaxID=658473 RepID=A0ABQ0LHA6_MYCCL|nr:predicted protein [Mycena chlorophos]
MYSSSCTSNAPHGSPAGVVNAGFDLYALSTFRLGRNSLSKSSAIEFLEDIADGRCLWARHVRKLEVYGFNVKPPEPESEELERSKAAALTGALTTMTEMHTINWEVRNNDLAWMHLAVQAALPHLPHLHNLSLNLMLYHPSNLKTVTFDLSGVGRLKTLSVIFGAVSIESPSIATQLVGVVARSPELETLELYSQDFSALWNGLTSTSCTLTNLTKLHTNHVDASLLHFLASQPLLHLTDLSLAADYTATDREACAKLAQTFFASVLPRYAATLTALSIRGRPFDRHWNADEFCIAAIRRMDLPRLCTLSLFITKESQARLAANVHAALGLIVLLPALGTMSLAYAFSQFEMPIHCHVAPGSRVPVKDGIQLAIESLSIGNSEAGVISGVEVRTDSVYRLEPVSEGGWKFSPQS